MEEDKVTLTRTRAELIESLGPASPADRVRIQGELSIINAKIKALNTMEAATNKIAADQRKAAGLAEAQMNAQRAVARAQAKHGTPASSAPRRVGSSVEASITNGRRTFAGPGVLHGGADGGHAFWSDGDDGDDDPGQTSVIAGWVDAVLLRHDVDFTRNAEGDLFLTSDRSQLPKNLFDTIDMLIAGLYAAARGDELPDLPALPKETSKAPKASTKPSKSPKAKPRKS